MRSSGFEPPRYCYRQPLKLVRLPVPPRPHRGENFIVAARRKPRKPDASAGKTEIAMLKPSVLKRRGLSRGGIESPAIGQSKPEERLYGFFGWGEVGCEDAGALLAGGCAAGCEEAGAALEPGGLVCGAEV